MTQTQIKLFKCDEIFCVTDDDEGDLGEGSYGKVRLGYHKRLGEIAIKCSEMKGGKQEKKLLEKRIKKEIGHLQQANHENIVRVYGWTHWPGAVAIIMEFLPAGNLKAILMDEDIVLGPLLRARFGEEIANGLAFIHNLFDDKRLLHGDLKPENILLTEDLHCKIGDFGAAQLSNYTGSSTTLTGYKDSNSIQLTKLYSAPERLRNISIKVSPKHDTYSYGMTLHMILAREMPLDTGTPVQTFTERIMEGQRPSEESIQEYLKKLEVEGLVSFADIIRFLKEQMTRCWQQDPADRPTMIDVKESLYSKLAYHDFQLIRKQVNEALEGITICKKAVFKEGCVTVNHFRPPDFSQNDSLSPIHSTIENDATLKRSSSLTANTDTSIESLDNTCTPANPSPAEQDGKSAEGFPDNNVVPPKLHGDSFQSEEIKENSAPENASSDKKSSNDRECMSRSSEFPEDKLELNARQTSQRKDSPVLSSKNDSITNVKDCFEYLRGCGLLENKWNNEVIETVGTKLGNLCRFVTPSSSKLLRNKVADEVLRCNAPPLFLQYFKLLIEDGNVYPTDSSKCALLKYLKQTIRSLSQFSSAFCVQCGKEGLITLMAVHLRHVQSCSGLETEEKELVEQTCIEILFNSAKTPECLMHVKVLNIFEIMSPFRKEMDKETDLKRKPILTFFAFLLSLVTEKEQIPLLKVHQSLIGYITSVISKCIVNKEKYIQLEKSFISVFEMCEGLARLARCTENARAILDVSESMKFITSLLKSEKGSYREVSLQIVDNISGSEENKGKISEQVELIKILKTISIKDPVENMRTMAKELCDILMCIEKDIGLNDEDKLPGDDRRDTRVKSYHDIVTIDEAKADVGSCLEYLQSCDWLETEWNKNMTDAAEKRLKKLLTYTDPTFSELFRKEIAYEVLREDAMSLFMRYFRTKVLDGNLYPRDSITCQFLEDFKQIVWNLADASAAFCVESCKKGLVPLIAVHFRHVQSVSWLSSEKKVKVSRTCLGILYNSARRPESLTHEKMLNIVNIPSQFRNEMAIEPKEERMEFLTFFAFLLSYVALEHQMHLLSVHQSLIKYIFDIIDEGLKNDERFEFESGAVSTLSEICDGLGQLARNKDNAANILNVPESMKRITSVLKSGSQKTKKSGLQLLHNLCLLNENKEEIRKQTGLIDLLRKILLKESVANLRRLATQIYQLLGLATTETPSMGSGGAFVHNEVDLPQPPPPPAPWLKPNARQCSTPIEKAKANVQSFLDYLRTCGLLENEWNEQLVEIPHKRILQIQVYVTSKYPKSFQNDVVDEMISHDVIPLFFQYFTILIDDGNEYPIDSVRYGFLEVLKGLVFNMTETSSEFCFECCKQGLITLMAVHLQYLQGLFWLPLEVKGYAEQKAVGILYNCAKRPEPLIYAKVQNTFEIMSEFRHEMVKEVGPERMEFLTFIAFSVTYMAEEDQLGSLKVHQSLINYIVENINKAVASNKDIKLKRGSYSLSEMFDGLAQLARNDDNAAAILKCPESVDYITKFLNSDQESNRKASLQLICNICQSKRNKGKVQKQLELFDLLTNMRINDPNQDLRLMADETCKFLSSPAEKTLSKLFKLRK